MEQPAFKDTPDYALQATADLPRLCGADMEKTADLMRQVLERTGFDAVNRLVRGASGTGDYDKEPFPRARRYHEARQLLNRIQSGKEAGAAEIRLAQSMRFFMFGDPLSRADLAALLSPASPETFQALAEAQIIVPMADGLWRTNDLSVYSQQLANGRSLFGLADTPSHYPHCRAAERVYIGPDSYLLSAQIQSGKRSRGPVAEVGSGSGYQLLVAAAVCPDAKVLCGLEIDDRAISVARFNSALNGFSDRITITGDADLFAEAFVDRRAELGLLNPPFMPVPDAIAMRPEDRLALGDLAIAAPENGPGHIALRPLFAKSGWGGLHGLQVTNEMLDRLLHAMDRSGRVIVQSTFSMRPGGRLDACDLPCLARASWEPERFFEAGADSATSPFDGPYRRTLSLRQVATEIGIILRQCPPACSRVDIDVAERMIDRIADAYAGAGIHGFVSGNLVLRSRRAGTP